MSRKSLPKNSKVNSTPSYFTIFPNIKGPFKSFLFGVVFGGCFGLVAGIIFYFAGFSFKPISLFILIVIILGAGFSGLAGLLGYYLDRVLIRFGVADSAWRRIFSFFILMFFVLGLTGWLLYQTKVNMTLYFLGSISGCGLGALLTIIDYKLGKIRQRMITLELENKYLAEISAKDRQLQETAKNLMIAEERNRMARELHDSVSQGIHGIIYTNHTLAQHLQNADPRTKELINHLQKTAEATLGELRAMIMELKPSLLNEHGLVEAIRLHSELFARRLPVELELELEPNLSGLTPEQEMAVYRIIQEALINIQRHSKAKKVKITLKKIANQILLDISDNGLGFIPERENRGNGIDNMEARCRENKGTFEINSIPGGGTEIKVGFEI